MQIKGHETYAIAMAIMVVSILHHLEFFCGWAMAMYLQTAKVTVSQMDMVWHIWKKKFKVKFQF